MAFKKETSSTIVWHSWGAYGARWRSQSEHRGAASMTRQVLSGAEEHADRAQSVEELLKGNDHVIVVDAPGPFRGVHEQDVQALVDERLTGRHPEAAARR